MSDEPGDLYVTVETSAELGVYEQRGFVLNRRESNYVIPVAAAIDALQGADVPAAYDVVDAHGIAEERLRLLDDALRQEVPGTDGWRWEPAAFREETFTSSAFDPATYLIARERASAEPVAIARVWNDPPRPRLGFIGVLPQHRRRGVARGLLARVFSVLAERGVPEVTTEVDDANLASIRLMTALGARRVGGTVELVRRAPAGGRVRVSSRI